MQNGATPHRTQGVFQAIQRVYGTRVIVLGYPKFPNEGLEEPPYSPEMNPWDYFLWGYIKDKCYPGNSTSKEELIKVIKKVVNGITTDMLQKVLYSFHKRINLRTQFICY